MPAFHAIMLVRQEADIIGQTLAHLLTWCDSLHILDTGSTDGTRDILRDAAAGEPRIKLIDTGPILYTNALRPWIFHQIRHQFRAGDWIARVDADEFYHIAPPRFIREHLSRGEGLICAAMYDFLLSREDLLAWREGRESVADRSRPIEERRRHFRFDPYPERRLFRYRRSMRWPAEYDPIDPGLLARARIPIRHYRARDPVQVQVRCAIREPTAEAGTLAGWHWKIADWRHFVFADDDPERRFWAPGASLQPHPDSFHRSARRMRLRDALCYRSGFVNLRDRFRTGFPADFRPERLPEETQRQIATNLERIRSQPYLRDIPDQVLAKRARLAAADPAHVP